MSCKAFLVMCWQMSPNTLLQTRRISPLDWARRERRTSTVTSTHSGSSPSPAQKRKNMPSEPFCHSQQPIWTIQINSGLTGISCLCPLRFVSKCPLDAVLEVVQKIHTLCRWLITLGGGGERQGTHEEKKVELPYSHLTLAPTADNWENVPVPCIFI